MFFKHFHTCPLFSQFKKTKNKMVQRQTVEYVTLNTLINLLTDPLLDLDSSRAVTGLSLSRSIDSSHPELNLSPLGEVSHIVGGVQDGVVIHASPLISAFVAHFNVVAFKYINHIKYNFLKTT